MSSLFPRPAGYQNLPRTRAAAIIPQAEVNIKTLIGHSLYVSRTNNSQNPGIPAENKLGSVISREDLHVAPDELVFTLWLREYRHAPTSDAMHTADSAIVAFTSFNGEYIPPGTTEEQWRYKFLCLGVAQHEYVLGDETQPNINFATQIAGSRSIPNNSRFFFMPGTLVMAIPPSIDPVRRAEVDVSRHVPHGIPKSKQVGTVAPVMPGDGMRFLMDAVDRLFERDGDLAWVGGRFPPYEVGWSEKPLERTTEQPRIHDATDSVAANLHRFITFAVIRAIAALDVAGVINFADIDGVNDGRWMTNRSVYDRLANNVFDGSFTLKQLSEGFVSVERGQPQFNPVDPNLVPALKNRRLNRLGFLAAILGAVGPNSSIPHAQPISPLVQSVMGGALYSLLQDQELKNVYDITRLVATDGAVANGVRNPGGVYTSAASLKNENVAFKSLTSLQNSVGHDLVAAITTAEQINLANVIGRSMGYSSPGGTLDVFMA